MSERVSSTPQSPLGRAYLLYRRQVISAAPIMQFVQVEVLDALARLSGDLPTAAFAEASGALGYLLADPALASDPEKQRTFHMYYRTAENAAFPATAAYLAECGKLSGLTQDLSLTAIDLPTLRTIDEKAHSDPAFKNFVGQLCAKLGEVQSAPDAKAYAQFFEIYGEAIVMLLLRARKVRVKRLPEAKTSMPDFECETDDGKRFFIEVKSLDVVDGIYRHKEMLHDALDSEVEHERQRRQGKRITASEREIAPYRKSGADPTYDPRSLNRVIDTLRSKWRQAFKASQFAQGPTFALAVVDRLVLPASQDDLAPYYFDDALDGGVSSGVLWQAAFGREGGLVLRRPDFAGKPGVEGIITAPGIFVDDTQPFDAVGIIVLDVHGGQRLAFGLASPHSISDDWTADDTEGVLGSFCDFWNDAHHSRGFELARRVNPVAVSDAKPFR
ncbi:hypothetical protein [Flavisphingomonas formosensis]|uniref:hypothetical protein n=1 Tax=Flavisphingomonas formosensis TaxID=861534 RepID=UPI0012FA8A35|nr:hypothetical protein [Sphingomonas formosensis]